MDFHVCRFLTRCQTYSKHYFIKRKSYAIIGLLLRTIITTNGMFVHSHQNLLKSGCKKAQK